VKIKDLYLGAYILCEGGKLSGLEIIPGRGKPTVVFHLEGPDDSRIFTNYLTGRAMVNVTALRSNLSYLKDRMFDAIRKEKQRGERYAAIQGGNRPD
jgi:hypothetical protein